MPEGCEVHVLAGPDRRRRRARSPTSPIGWRPTWSPLLAPASRPDRPTGELTAEAVALAVGALLPEGAVVVDEAATSGIWAPGATAGGPKHDWLTLTGGAIGIGLPLAVGAAVACPTAR